MRVNNLLSQKAVFPGLPVKQAPVHLYVPDVRVAGACESGYDPEIEESIVLIHLFTVFP